MDKTYSHAYEYMHLHLFLNASHTSKKFNKLKIEKEI
jgi:hypothetical protein